MPLYLAWKNSSDEEEHAWEGHSQHCEKLYCNGKTSIGVQYIHCHSKHGHLHSRAQDKEQEPEWAVCDEVGPSPEIIPQDTTRGKH